MPIVKCDWCRDEFEQSQYKLDRNDNQFCSRDCYYDWKSSEWDSPDSKVDVECEHCAETFRVYPYRSDSARFCSRECSDASMRGTSGDETPRWNGGKPEHACKNCGETFKRYDAKGRDCDYCSKECYREASEELFAGEDNPVWRGGNPDYYGPNWEEQRQRAISRDNHRCQDCGIHADDMDRSPDVHHKKRIGWFKEEYDSPEWWEKGNQLDNLVTLCQSCHKMREWDTA